MQSVLLHFDVVLVFETWWAHKGKKMIQLPKTKKKNTERALYIKTKKKV